MLREIKNSYAGVGGIIYRYWEAYGGIKSILISPYFHASVILALLLAHLWIDAEWWTDAIAALPGMIGFAIGAYAIVLGFGDERFRAIITQRKNGKISPYVQISASLAHFIVVQLAALLAAIIAKGFNFELNEKEILGKIFKKMFGSVYFFHDWISPVGQFIGFVMFVYAMATALATAMAIFRLTNLLERDEK